MTTCHVFIAASLDGFIARKDGGIDWLAEGWPNVDHDYGYQDFIYGIDGLVMGSGSYEKALTFTPWPYTKPVVVMSRKLSADAIPAALFGQVSITRETPLHVIGELKARGWKRVYVEGGQIIQSFLREGLIDDLVVTHIPILLGEGRPLFGAVAKDIRLIHKATKPYESGFVQSYYAVDRG